VQPGAPTIVAAPDDVLVVANHTTVSLALALPRPLSARSSAHLSRPHRVLWTLLVPQVPMFIGVHRTFDAVPRTFSFCFFFSCKCCLPWTARVLPLHYSSSLQCFLPRLIWSGSIRFRACHFVLLRESRSFFCSYPQHALFQYC